MIIRQIKRLIDIYKFPRENGIFSYMFNDSRFLPILNGVKITDIDTAHNIDFDYIYRKSGLKTCSLFLQELYNDIVNDDNLDEVFFNANDKVVWEFIITETNKRLLNDIIYSMYYDKWAKLVSLNNVTYDPLSPYNVKVTENNTSTLQSKNDRTGTSTSTSTDTTDGTNVDTTSKFSYTGAEENTDRINSKIDNTDTNNSNSSTTDSTDYTRNETDNRNLTRIGNIGNITNQDLVVKERSVVDYSLLKVLYNDLDKILTSQKYL